MFGEKSHKYLFYLVLGVAFVLRFINLGYSDYQGDEIKAFFILEDNQTLSNFLLEQRKGPVQFLVTGALKLIDPTYSNRFLIRLPFALAGFFAVWYFYKFVEKLISKEVALFSSLFLATNGFFVAFSRIVQYQAFVILFMTMSLYYLLLALKDPVWAKKGMWLGLITWALSVLSHYDGLLIAPFVLYLLIEWFKTYKNAYLKSFLASGLFAAALLCLFYVPFIANIADSTSDYWQGRITGDVSAKLSSSRYLFTVYQPIYVVHIYTALFVFGFLFSCYNFVYRKQTMYAWLVFWLGVPLLFLEWYVYIPGTHIYTYIYPMFIILGVGLAEVYKIATLLLLGTNFKPYLQYFYKAALAIVYVFISWQSYAVFVDHAQEYPWENEKWLFFTFPKPTPIYHLSMFGFPYYRFWDEIGQIISSDSEVKAYSTNERASIARYHVGLPKSTDRAGYFIYIIDPQSFTNDIIYDKAAYWRDNYGPVLEFKKGNKVVVELLKMEPGTLEDIKDAGL